MIPVNWVEVKTDHNNAAMSDDRPGKDHGITRKTLNYRVNPVNTVSFDRR
jgi:hypothetical protein